MSVHIDSIHVVTERLHTQIIKYHQLSSLTCKPGFRTVPKSRLEDTFFMSDVPLLKNKNDMISNRHSLPLTSSKPQHGEQQQFETVTKRRSTWSWKSSAGSVQSCYPSFNEAYSSRNKFFNIRIYVSQYRMVLETVVTVIDYHGS